MILIGHHGTTAQKASSILKQGFMQSRKNTEWLGFGVYFFADINWAVRWANQECTKKDQNCETPNVLIADINCRENGLFDLDVPENMRTFSAEVDTFLRSAGKGNGAPNLRGSQQDVNSTLRCFACNYYRRLHPEIKVYSYTFPAKGYNSVGFPINQRQYCVTDNTRIQNVRKWEGDYAI